MRTRSNIIYTYAIFGAVAGVVLTAIALAMIHFDDPNGSIVSHFSDYDLEERFGFTYALPWFDSRRKQISIISTFFVTNALLSGLIGAVFGCVLIETFQTMTRPNLARPSRRGCNSRVPEVGSLSLGR